MDRQRVDLKPGKTYKKRYRMNTVGRDGATTTVAIPPEVLERKAEEMGMTAEEFTKKFRAVAQYNNFDGVFYAFEPIPEEDKDKGNSRKAANHD